MIARARTSELTWIPLASSAMDLDSTFAVRNHRPGERRGYYTSIAPYPHILRTTTPEQNHSLLLRQLQPQAAHEHTHAYSLPL